MIYLITGKKASGKSKKALEITKGKKYVLFNEIFLKSAFCFNGVDSMTEYIIIDDVKNKESVEMFLKYKKLQIERQCKTPEIIDMPNVILISKNLTKKDFPCRIINVIECTCKKRYNKLLLSIVTILLLCAIIVYLCRLYFPENFNTVSFFENYLVFTFKLCLVVFIISIFILYFLWACKEFNKD